MKYHFNCLIFTTFLTYRAVLRSFDCKSVKVDLSLQTNRKIPTLYEEVHDCLGHPQVVKVTRHISNFISLS